MNKVTQITKFKKSANYGYLKLIAVACFMFAFNISSFTQVDCNTIMVCNDLVQVSLDKNCVETVKPDMILQDQAYANSNYTVVVSTANGSIVPNAILTKVNIGKTYIVAVTLNGCNLSCVGSISVEDKLPPVISNCPSATVKCGASTAPGVIARPTAVDACGTVSLTSTDKEVVSQCLGPYVKVITRTWTAIDQIGNKSTCVQTINITRPTIKDVTIPKNYDNIDLPAFTCGAVIEYLPNGAPSPSVTGTPGGADCANIMFFYNDVVFNICGASKKILRQWTILDWCTGKDTVAAQVIKIIDNAPPVCVSPPDFKFNIKTDEGKCTGTFKVPPPNVVFECSKYDYVVGYKLRSANGSPYINPVFDNVVKTTNADGTYFYTINKLPADTSWVVYQITDACGNYSECFTEVIVKDGEAPSPVCNGYLIVTVDNKGVGDLYAQSVDDGSNDNCGIQKFLVKRKENNCGRPEDLEFRDKVVFCCADVNSNPLVYQQVTLRVFDKDGNFADCTSNVKVQDKSTPVITVPPDVTLACEQDYKNLALTKGRATATGNCSVKIDSIDSGTLKCGVGVINRTWRATSAQGIVATKVQKITIIDNTPFVLANITWPANIETNGCIAADATPEKLNSKPTYVNIDCADLAVSYDDELFDVPGACLKILRTWRVINWCDANPQNPVFFTYVQKITLKNSTPPVFATGCAPKTISSGNDCEAFVQHSVTATDDCTPASQLIYTWAYDKNNNNTVDATGTGKEVGRLYPSGTHKITFTVKDGCENTATCTYLFTVKDSKAPSPICHGQITWVLDEAGKAVVWASDFNLKSVDLCDGETLKFAFDAAGTLLSRSFTCADVANGVQASIPIKMYAIDVNGNSDFCTTTLILQDSPNKNACPNTTLTATVSGTVSNKIDVGFGEVEVNLENMNDHIMKQTVTTSAGAFKFEDVAIADGYMINPTKKDDVLNGLSTLDLILIQRHILGVKQLENPFDILAADINMDKKISASDLVGLRKVILGIDKNFVTNTPWRFVPSTYSFADPKSPFEVPQGISLTTITNDTTNINFTTVKTGDVNNTASYNFKNTVNIESRTSPIVLLSNASTFKQNETVSLTLKVSDNVNISGLQFGLNFDKTKLAVEKISSSRMSLNNTNFHVEDNLLKVSADLLSNTEFEEGDDLITIVFRAKESGDIKSLRLNETDFANEIYDNDYNIKSIILEWINTNNAVTENTSIKNHPNPFSDATVLKFTAQNEGVATMKVVDATGKLIYKINEQFVKGINKITIKKENLNNQSGIYFYQLEINSTIHTGAMILSE